jgi:cytochrome c peroxidase
VPTRILGAACLACTLIAPGHAQTAADMLAAFEREARQARTPFDGFSAQRGEQFFRSTHGGDWTCATCHTESPLRAGKHARTGKAIQPLAPAANRARFADAAKAEKWFKRNCNDVLSRACTAQEKGDVLAWLLQIK